MMFHETAGHACMSAARRALAVLAVLAALTAGCSQDVAEPRDVVRAIKTFRIPAPEAEVGETVVTTYRYPAKISAVARVVEMAFEVSGKLVECSVSEGREVKAGQLLARLDAPGIADALDTARAQRDRAEADRDRAIAADQSDTGSKQNVAEAEARLRVRLTER